MRELLLKKNWESETVEIEGIGKVHMREMSGAERAKWAAQNVKDGGVANEMHMTALLVVMSAHDEHGVRIFSEGDVEAIKVTMSWALVEKLGIAALKANNLGKLGLEAARKN